MIRFALFFVLASLWPPPASARVQRFALIVANEKGASGQETLRYSLNDADRMQMVLRDLGGFAPEDTVMLQNESAETVRRSLVSLNARIRQTGQLSDTQTILMVYYSGHGDTERLQLGETALDLRELQQLVQGSSADFRVLILDACRSGSITRAKGGHRVPAPPLPMEEFSGSGLAYLTASSGDEDAQESDVLKGSFFTQSLVTAMLGAADNNADGAVSLDEAYRYAYDATLRATSRTLSGTQHPAFRYDMRGHGDVTLSRPGDFLHERAQVTFPKQLPILVLRENAEGPVVAELARGDGPADRGISLSPGRYFVRARGDNVLYEGTFQAQPGRTQLIDVDQLRQVEYSQLVRKGASSGSFAQKLELGGMLRSPLERAAASCMGLSAAYGVDFAQLGVLARFSYCSGDTSTSNLPGTIRAYTGELRIYHAWDTSIFSLSLGLVAGVTVMDQRFQTALSEHHLTGNAPFLGVAASIEADLFANVFAVLDVAASTYFLRLQDAPGASASASVNFALNMTLGLGVRF